MNIGSGNGYPSSALSNFAPHPFILDGVLCNSMEGFLQALKFENPEMQKHVCSLVGMQAKYKGKKKAWWVRQELYWLGKTYPRDSQDYQDLLDRAYDALAQNAGFARALLATRNASLTHTIGRTNPSRTVLTVQEFCGRLLKIRARLAAAQEETP